MTGWIIAFLLAGIAFALASVVLKAPRKGWEAIGAALMLGLAGYALQGSPSLPGASKQPEERDDAAAKALVAARQELAKNEGGAPDNWIIVSDAFSRNGQFADAAGVVLGAIDKNPNNADAWLALANNLVGHAQGSLTPAALYAYRRASAANPAHPGPPFFLGLALAQNGKLAEGRALWAALLAKAPADAPWRADLQARLEELDAFIAQQQVAPNGPVAGQ